MNRQFPCVEIDLQKIRHNTREIMRRCAAMGIQVCGVVKGCNAKPEIARVIKDCGVTQLASSRLEQIVRCRKAGIPGPYMLLRIPGLSELKDLVQYCEWSLQSEVTTLDALERECARQGREHRVIIMAELGDLREGIWNRQELVEICLHVERDLPHVILGGVGVNLGCVGSIQPTPEKMQDLVDIAHQVEAAIGRKLELVSGGATTSFSMVHYGTMPKGINHLRIGEAILLSNDLTVNWGISDMDYLYQDAFIIRAEVVEVRDKPTYPDGRIFIDAFGHTNHYEDRGIRRRAILALGRVDVFELEALIPREDGIKVLGGSSDHCVIDVEDCLRNLQVGDIVEFQCGYSTMLYCTSREDIKYRFINE